MQSDKSLSERIRQLEVGEGEVGIFWLGNAGFVFKNKKDAVIYLDPYLSDCANRMYGFKRLYPSPVSAEEVSADYLLITHEHGDHLDADSVPEIMTNDETELIGPNPVIEKCLKLGVESKRLIEVEPGEELSMRGVKVKIMATNHGELSPNAVGYVLEFDRTRVYVTGDTSYDRETLRSAFKLEPEVVILPINGKFNNLDPLEAALVAKHSDAEMAIPAHFWTFAEHGGNPGMFKEKLKKVAPDIGCQLLTQGEPLIYPKA